jgi:hypothetical protein
VSEIEALAEATIRPEQPKTETVAEIRVLDNAVEILFPERREDFRELVRFKLGYTWTEPCWKRELKSVNGSPADRAAEAHLWVLKSRFSGLGTGTTTRAGTPEKGTR